MEIALRAEDYEVALEDHQSVIYKWAGSYIPITEFEDIVSIERHQTLVNQAVRDHERSHIRIGL